MLGVNMGKTPTEAVNRPLMGNATEGDSMQEGGGDQPLANLITVYC